MLLVEMSCTSVVFSQISGKESAWFIPSGHLPENRPNPGKILNIYIQTSTNTFYIPRPPKLSLS